MLNYRNPTPNTKTKSQKQKNVRQYAWQPTYRLACASHAPASAAQAAYCAPQRQLPSFATERKLVRAQAATRARATPPAPQIRSAAAKHTTTTPSSRHECPCALLNTRWRVMRRGTDAPPLLRAPAAQSRQVRLWRRGAGGGGVNQRTETVQAEAGSGGAGVARAGGMDEVDAGRRGGGGFVRFWVAGVELTVGPYWLLAPNG